MKQYRNLIKPYLVWAFVVIVIPLILIALYAFTEDGNEVLTFSFTLENFRKFLESTYMSVIFLVMRSLEAEHDSIEGNQGNSEEIEWEAVAVESSKIRIRMEADFQNQHDKVRFLYWSDEKWKQIGPWHQLYFKMDHFTGCRVGLFAYATKETGGIAEFGRFRYF